MGKTKPSTYRIGRVLKRLLGFGFGDSFLHGDLSKEGIEQAKDYSSSHGPISLLHPNGEKQETESAAEKYIQYQKEFQAKKHLDSPDQPKTPGRILRLPPQRFFESDTEDQLAGSNTTSKENTNLTIQQSTPEE